MDLTQINYWAVFVAALANFVIGALWYTSILFGNAWMKETGMTEEKAKKSNMPLLMGTTFLLGLIMSFLLAAFIGPESNLVTGAVAGALAGIGWVAVSTGIQYLFEQKSFRLFLINAGYQAVTFIVMGGILGAWH